MEALLGRVGGAEKLYVDDVFSTYLYTGNGSSQTINNGIDLAGKGGMVWQKCRNTLQEHYIVDTARGNTKWLETQSVAAEQTAPGTTNVKSFDSTGFTLGGDYSIGPNVSGRNYASWTFRKAPKFFDVVTYTGNGVAGLRTFNHSLNNTPGIIIIKDTSATNPWIIYHRSITAGNNMEFSTGTTFANGYFATAPTTTQFSVDSTASTATTNVNGNTYVAYLFAHDTTADGIIQCGSFTTDGGGNATVNLGWEPQYLLFKKVSATGNWKVADVVREFSRSGWAELNPDASSAESPQGGANILTPDATGFSGNSSTFSVSSTYIYLAIRRPNKPPTSGTEVYNAIAYGDGTASSSMFSVMSSDSVWFANRAGAVNNLQVTDKLRGYQRTNGPSVDTLTTPTIHTSSTSAETTSGNALFINTADDYVRFSNTGTGAKVAYNFRRAPGFFDVVCYTGTGSAHTESHNLNAVPELVIIKGRVLNSGGNAWAVWCQKVSATNDNGYLQGDNTFQDYGWVASATSTGFSIGASNHETINQSAKTYVAYLFATLPGISKVGSYTGNGSSQNIECGFPAGARFILIKRTDSTGDWYVWDTARGIVSANDPHLSLNTTATEVTTDDSVDPYAGGFAVNQVAATNINVTSATYIFLAIA